jgi:carboxypeptidase C (cathepsin A)
MLLAFVLALGASSPAAAQRGGRGAAAAQQAGAATDAQAAPAANSGTPPAAAPTAAAGRAGRAGAAAAGVIPGDAGGSNDFYNFNPAAAAIRPDPSVERPPVETHQKITVGGQALAYTARVGFLPVLNATTGAAEAHLFFTSYSKDGVSDPGTRPIMFFFGGPPGVSAAWQEFGGLGPKRMKAEGGWGDNPDTILAQSDLVFVNPVGTGFSFPVQPSRGTIFWNTAGDTASLGEFVRIYLERMNRLASPLFIAGEDASTGRVAGLSEYLSEHLIPVKGVILLSMMASADSIAGDFQYITLLPSLTMSSWYHKKLSPEMNAMSAEQIAGQARQFASREYLHALYKGDRMTAEEKTKVIADLSRMTGLSKSFLINNELRVTLDRYNSELMRDQRMGLSRSDARVTGYIPMAGGGRGGGGGGGGRGGGRGGAGAVDFNMSKISGPFATAYVDYLRRELTFTGRKDGIFYLASGGVGTFTSTGNDDANLAAAFARNPNLHLFIGIDFFDLGLPFYAAEYTLAHLDVSPEVRAHNITVSHQEAGSMAYLDSKALGRLEHDLGSFVSSATK